VIVKVHWNEFREEWIMTDHNGRFIHTFPDCVNFNRIFQGIQKGVDNFVSLQATVGGGTNDKG